MIDIRRHREPGPDAPLERTDLAADPVVQLRTWLEAAAAAGVREPNAMTLATADATGRPSARVVLLRGLDEMGLIWYTHRRSQKARDLAANPHAAVVFHWELVGRQVRVSGDVVEVPDAETRAYFAERPRRSQLAAWASPQGQVLRDREELESAIEGMGARYPTDVPLPPFWGGYRLRPSMFEFWQARRDRTHDRFRYLSRNGRWTIDRLAP